MEAILVSVADAARMLGIGKTNLYSLLADGKLETRVLGRRRLIKVSSIRAFADELAA